METIPTFRFRYLLGMSAPYETVDAPTDNEGYQHVLDFLKAKGVKLMRGSIERRDGLNKPTPMPDPGPALLASEAEMAAVAFSEHRGKHPDPEPLSPLQERMRSGGPGKKVE